VAVVCVVFTCRAPGRLQSVPSDSLEVRCCSRGSCSSSSFFRHTSSFHDVLNPQQNGFSVRYSVPRGHLIASTEHKLHRYDRVTLRKVGFDCKCALLVGPYHLYDGGILYRELSNYLHLSSPTPTFYAFPSLHNALLKLRRLFCPTLYIPMKNNGTSPHHIKRKLFWPKTVYRSVALQGATKTLWQNVAHSSLHTAHLWRQLRDHIWRIFECWLIYHL